MKRFVINLFIITALFLFANLVYLYACRMYTDEFQKAVEASKFENKNFDCLVLGNSCAMDGIDTQLLSDSGILSYNLAIGGTTLTANYIQLDEYLKKNKVPKKVILGFSPNSPYHFDTIEVHPLVEYFYVKPDWQDVGTLPMFKFKWLAKELIKKTVSKEHRDAHNVRGQYRCNRTILDNTSFIEGGPVMLREYLNKFETAKYLVKIDSLCRAKNIELIVLEMPGFKDKQNDFDSFIHDFKIRNGQRMSIYSLNDKKLCKELINSKTDWLATDHLNSQGAQKVTKYIYSNILKKNKEPLKSLN